MPVQHGEAVINLIENFLQFANRLKFRNLFLVTVLLFIVNFLIPDFIPFIDEILLGLFAIVLANIKRNRKVEDKGDIIEGEIVTDDSSKDQQQRR